MHPDDARSDFILAAATLLFGRFAVSFLVDLPGYPGGLAGQVLLVFWVFALTGLVPLLLVRYRNHGGEAFGLDTQRSGLTYGVVLAVPVVINGVLRGLVPGGSLVDALLGRLSPTAAANPVVDASAGGFVPVELLLDVLLVASLGLGSLLLIPFLTVRAADGFRRTELSLTEAIRTFGLGTAGAALVLGLLRSLGGVVTPVRVLLNTVTLVALVLLTDRVVELRTDTSRATMLAPALVTLIAFLFLGGGIIGGDLLLALYAGSIAAGLAIVVATLVEAGQGWAVLPLVAALVIYPPPCFNVVPFSGPLIAC